MTASIAAGTLLSDTYRIVRPLSRGGMGEVYEGRHLRTQAAVCIKVLLATAGIAVEQLGRFRREAEIASCLNHPNIVRVFDFNHLPDGRPFLVMELLEGTELSRLIEPGVPLVPAVVLPIVDQIARALCAAHERGIVHRDLKPGNVFLTRVAGADSCLVKLLDFGISKVRDATTALTRTNTIMGTPHYMAPEQCAGKVDLIDPRTDQFALGALAYEMLCGRMAFPGEETLAVFNRVVHDHPPPVRSFAPALPAAVNNVLGRALAKEREARFPTVGDFAAAFAQALDVASGAASAIPAAHGAGHPLRTALMEVVAPSTTLRSSAGDMDAVPDPELASLRASPKRRAFLLSVAALGATAVFAIAHRPRRLAGTAALDSNPFRSAGSPASKDPAPVPPAPTRRSPPHLTARDAAAEAPRSLRAAAVPAPVELPSPAPSTAPRTAHPVNAAVSRGPRSKSRAASARAPSAPRASDPQAGSPAPQLHNEDL